MKKTLCLQKIVFFALFFGNAITLQAQSWQDTVALIDKVFSRYTDMNPGAELAISRNGRIIYSSARGMADLEHSIPFTKTTKTEAGSVSKQFTAACILLLEQQGKLSLNDDIHKYVPEIPNYGNTITIRHLMTHVSGIKDWGSIAELSGWPRTTKAYANSDALHIISLQKTLNNKPGDEYIYSNSGYNLLAIIIQRVSGTSLSQFSKKYLFEPAGMKNTEWRDDYQRVVPNRAIAYSKKGNIYYTNMPNENVYGNGGLLTTAEDLLLWNNFYLTGKLGSPSLLSKQLATTPFNNGKRHIYAAGLMVDSLYGWASITHSGATAGYRANLDHFPQLGLSIAWLSNTGQPDMSDIPSAIRSILIKNLRPPVPIATTQNIAIRNFDPYLGTYRDDKTGSGMKIFAEDSALYIQPHTKLNLLSKNSAAMGRTRLVFTKGTVNVISGSDTTVYESAPPPDLVNLKNYAGEYASEETESKMKIILRGGKLSMAVREEEEVLWLTPIYKNGYSYPYGDIFFETDTQGNITKLYISISRARKVAFTKIN